MISDISELMQQDVREKRMAKLSCVTKLGDRDAPCVFCGQFHLTMIRSGCLQKDLFKER